MEPTSPTACVHDAVFIKDSAAKNTDDAITFSTAICFKKGRKARGQSASAQENRGANKSSNEEEKGRKALSSFRLKTTKGMNTAFDAQVLQQ